MIESHSILEPLKTAQHFVPPSARELRSQAVYRLQIGLFGLCAMLLIVGLANVIRDRIRLNDSVDPIQEVVAVDAKPTKTASDPLADIGVVPAADPSPTPTPSASASPVPGTEMTGDPSAQTAP
ncbi:hypothetical protein [Novosphingobium guangzhouense]|uniref:Uncharacterized protein n=1 Tax=Novosphingobium guangzhouense TaxID=1850347 RepID=A0A2K2FSX2_9SPHN|nr:hypothetical protein [Novosphingobium guangzhouense]PNU01885.1 hypothetical protein A8V01_10510 [Novosphingobium guangzhouense]